MPRWPPGRWRRTAACRVEVVVGEEVTTLGGHLLALFLERAGPLVPLAAHDDRRRSTTQGGIAIPAHPLVPVPAVRPGLRCSGGSSTTPTRASGPTRSRRSTRRRSAGRGTAGSSGSPTQHGLAHVGNSDAHALDADRARLDDVPGPDARRTCGRRSPRGTTRHHGSFHGDRRPARDVRASSCASTAATPATSVVGRVRRDGTGRDLGYPGRPARGRRAFDAGTAGDEDRPRLPVRLPAAGRGHPARPVPLREPPPARPRRPDHHQQPRPAALVRGRHHPDRRRLLDADQRLGRDAHVLAALHQPGPRDARARAVRPAPLPRAVRAVPVALPAARVDERQRGDLPRLRRLLAVVRARQPGHARPRGAAPRPDRGQRGRAPLHRPLLPGRLQGHPQRRRRPALRRRGPDRPLAGRHAEPAVRRPARAAQGPARPARRRSASCARPATTRACSSWARGRRSAKRGATWPRAASRASSSSAASATPRRPSCSGPPTSSCRRRPAASRSGSSCSRRWPPGRRSSARTSTATRASSAAVARACWCRRASPRSWRWPIARAARRPGLASEMGAAGRARAEEFSWPRVTAKVDEYYGFVIRRLAAGGQLPAGFRAADPSGAAASGRGRPSSSDAPGAAPIGQRQPPDPGRVGDHQAGHDQGDREQRRASA